MKIFLMAVGFVALATIALASGDVWKDKPYQQWDSKDVQKILDDSPWSHVVRVDATWITGNANQNQNQNPDTNAPVPQNAAPSMGGSPRTMGGGASGGGGTMPSSEGMPSTVPQTPSAAFVVRWSSSRVLREAAVRSAVLAGEKEPADVDASIAKPPDDYQVEVTGQDMTPFLSANQDTLKSDASLVLKHSKQKISPANVTIQKDSTGRKISYILFSFPKSESGAPVIDAKEKSVEFELTSGKTSIKSTFDIPKMTDNQGVDL